MKRLLVVLLIFVATSACGFLFDDTPPVITSISASEISYSSATVTWTTDENATSQVEYGTTTAYGSTTKLDKKRVENHSVELINLDPDTTYYYRVTSKDFSGNQSISIGNTLHTVNEEIYGRTYRWDFRRSSWTYTTDIPQSMYDYFADKSRVADYSEYVLDPNDDAWMEELANLFLDEAEKKGWDESYHIPFVLSFVQSMPYTSDSVTTGYDEYPRYPLETIVDEGGDCEDTSILFASIVREMGYGVVLLYLEDDEHMAAGVLISQSFIDNWDKGYSLTYYTASNGKKYAYCETTGEGWGFGEMPNDLIGTAEILDVF